MNTTLNSVIITKLNDTYIDLKNNISLISIWKLDDLKAFSSIKMTLRYETFIKMTQNLPNDR